MLYIVPTPIGNLSDITYRAVQVLNKVDKILAEDTRVTLRLLRHYGIEKPIQSFHAHNEHRQLDVIVSDLLEGTEIALVSDAGSPGISDPGFLLVRACREKGVPVTFLPGANAIIPALVGSGFPCDRFYFEGFLPVKKGRNTRLIHLERLDQTIVLFESPHKILKTLKDLYAVFNEDRRICVAREISKIHEEFLVGTFSELIHKYEQKTGKIKGEITLVIEGKKR